MIFDYLVSHEAGHVNRFASLVLWEGLDTTSEGFGPLLREEPLGAVPGRLKLTMRHSSLKVCPNISMLRQNTYSGDQRFEMQVLGDAPKRLNNGVLLIEKVSDEIIILTEASFQHNSTTLVSPEFKMSTLLNINLEDRIIPMSTHSHTCKN